MTIELLSHKGDYVKLLRILETQNFVSNMDILEFTLHVINFEWIIPELSPNEAPKKQVIEIIMRLAKRGQDENGNKELGLFLKKLIDDGLIEGFDNQTAIKDIINRNRLLVSQETIQQNTNFVKEILKTYREMQPTFDGTIIRYIEPEAVWVTANTWAWDDKQISQSCYYDINRQKKADTVSKIVERYFLNGSQQFTLLGASFGSGKTTVAKKLVSKYANDYLSQDEGYIPLLGFLKGNEIMVHSETSHDIVHSEIGLESVLEMLSPKQQEAQNKKKVLLILDGFEDYSDKEEDPMKHLEGIINNFKGSILFKIILTKTQEQEDLENTLLQYLGSERAHRCYIRLLPFNDKQVDAFFEAYQCKIPSGPDAGKSVTYQYIRKLGWHEHEISNPLFTWMIAMMYSGQRYNTNAWSEEKRKSFLVLWILHRFIPESKRRHDDATKPNDIKNALRLTSALVMLSERNSTEKERKVRTLSYHLLEDGLSLLKEAPDDITRKLLERSLFGSYIYRDSHDLVKFIHVVFQEYLLSEYFIETILAGRLYRLNIGTPTHQTMRFIDGLIDLLLDTRDHDSDVKAIMFFDHDSVLRSFGEDIRGGDFTQELIDFRYKMIQKLQSMFAEDKMEEIIIRNDFEKKECYWKKVAIPYDNYNHLSLHKWISIYFLSKLIHVGNQEIPYPTKDIKIGLNRFLLNSANINIPYYLKRLNWFDLSFTDLSYANLSYFNLDYCNLFCVNLFFSNISNANLEKTNLSLANLHRTYITNSDLPDANLRGANLRLANLTRSRFCLPAEEWKKKGSNPSQAKGADLSGADLTGAILHRAEFIYAILEDANLTRADLTEADLRGANLTRADLTEADLRGANLTRADLTEADLTGTNLEGAKLNGAMLSRTNLSGASHPILLKGSWPNVTIDESEKIPFSLDPRIDLTGIWRANDGAVYCINHSRERNEIWWFGVSNANRFGNVFRSYEIRDGIISGRWADVPRGTELNNGKLDLRIKKEVKADSKQEITILQKRYQTGGFAGSIWKKINDLEYLIDERELDNIYSLHTIRKPFGDLSGRWRSADTSFNYYIHEVEGNIIWWFSVNRDRSIANVFNGLIDSKREKLSGELAELPNPKLPSRMPGIKKMELTIKNSPAGGEKLEIKDEENRETLVIEKLLYAEL